MTDPILTPFRAQRNVLLTTYKRDGTPIGTPVHVAVDGDRAYVKTYDKAWKHKRVRNVPRVLLAPSTLRGRPTGDAVALTGRVLDDDDARRRAQRALAAKYPVLQGHLIPWAHRWAGYRTIFIELRAGEA